MAKNKLYLMSGIYSFTAESMAQKIDEAKGDIDLYINSPGGSVFAGWSIIFKMAEYKSKFNAKVIGTADSMAFYITLFADRVEAIDVARFVVHRANGYINNAAEQKELDRINVDIRAKMEARINADKFKEVTGYTLDQVFDPEQRIDIVLTAEKAKAVGLVDEIIRLEPRVIEAMTEKFVAMDVTELQGSSHEAQGSASQKAKDNNNNFQQKRKIMTVQELRAQHPDLVAQITAEAVEVERDRVSAIMTFAHLDAEACKAEIEKGKPMSQTFIAQMTLKSTNASQVQAIEQESPEAVTPPADEVEAHTKELSDFEAEMNEKLGIKKGGE